MAGDRALIVFKLKSSFKPFTTSNMPLNELFPAVSQLSHQDKLRLIHFLLLEVAREEGCELESTDDQDQENLLLKQLASTEAVVWSPYEAYEAAKTLSDLLVAAKKEGDA